MYSKCSNLAFKTILQTLKQKNRTNRKTLKGLAYLCSECDEPGSMSATAPSGAQRSVGLSES